MKRNNLFNDCRYSAIGSLLANTSVIAAARNGGCSTNDARLLQCEADRASHEMAKTLATMAVIIREWRSFVDDPLITEKEALTALEYLAIMTGEVITEAHEINISASHSGVAS